MLHEQQVLDLVGHIFDAAPQVSHRLTVLRNFIRLTHCRSGNLSKINLATGATRRNAAIDMLGKRFPDSDNYYWPTDIWTPKPDAFAVVVVYKPLCARMPQCY